MLEFGILSSLFDIATFLVLLYMFKAQASTFRTGWFVESLLTQLLVVLTVRTRHSLLSSRPSVWLVRLTLGVVVLTLVLTYLPVAKWLGFVRPAPALMAAMIVITLMYVIATEIGKGYFYRHWARRTPM